MLQNMHLSPGAENDSIPYGFHRGFCEIHKKNVESIKNYGIYKWLLDFTTFSEIFNS